MKYIFPFCVCSPLTWKHQVREGNRRETGSDGDNDEEADEDKAGSGKKKKAKLVRTTTFYDSKLTGISPQDISDDNRKVNDRIKAVELKWKCCDKQCGSQFCWIDSNGRHQNLTYQLRNIWGAAIVRVCK